MQSINHIQYFSHHNKTSRVNISVASEEKLQLRQGIESHNVRVYVYLEAVSLFEL